jgi:hypothetical protein
MKLPFQTWLENGSYSENAKHLLRTAITCYKAEAYTASLLMSYLGFLVILKERLLQANKPALFPVYKWTGILTGIKNDDKWEEQLHTAINMGELKDSTKKRTQDPVFAINDDLRNQIQYWKYRRNDCAHNKENPITIAHVEAFWTFLESNLSKITVEGGMATLINKLDKHYDPLFTPTSADVSPLVSEIKGAVYKGDLEEFWGQALSLFSRFWDHEKVVDFVNKVMRLSDATITQSLLLHFKSQNRDILDSYINAFPSILLQLNLTSQDIRNFWKTKIGRLDNAIGIYATMLRNNMIPDDELTEANERIARLFRYTNNQDDHMILAAKGFGDVLYNNLFAGPPRNHFKYWRFLNDHSDTITLYIQYYPLNDELMNLLFTEMNKTNWNAQFLANNLNELFKNDAHMKAIFNRRLTDLGLGIPHLLDELNN